jgi:hypothetical protein
MADQKVRVEVTAETGQARREFEGFTSSVRSSIGGVQAVAGNLHAQILSLGAVLAGSAFVAGIKSQIDLMDATRKGAQAAGVSVQAFDEMRYAAKLADVDVDVLSKTMAKLSGAMVKVAAGDKDLAALFGTTLKVPVRGANGALRETDKVLEDLAERFEAMEEGPKKVALAAQLFGEKLGPKLIPFLNQGKQGIQDLREELRKLTGGMTDGQTAAAEQFNDNMTRLGTVGTSLGRQIANDALPPLIEYSDFFLKAAKNVGTFEAAIITLGKAMAAGLGVDDVGKAEASYSAANAEVARLQQRLVGVQNVLAVDPGNVTALRQQATLVRNIAIEQAKVLQAGAAIGQAREGMGSAGGGRGFVNPALALKRTPYDPDSADIAGKPAVNRMAQWEAELAERKVKVQEQANLEGTFREFSKSEEAAYWAKILATQRLSEAEGLAVRTRTASATLDVKKAEFTAFIADLNQQREALEKNYAERILIAEQAQAAMVAKYGAESREAIDAAGRVRDERRKLAEQNVALENIRIDRVRMLGLEEVNDLERNAQLQVQLGVMTQERLLEIKLLAINRREAIEVAAKEAEIQAMKGGPEDPEAYERLQLQLAEIRARYKGAKADNKGQQQVEQGKPFESFFGASQAAIEQGLNSMVMRMQLTLAGLKATARQIGASLVQELVTKPAAEFLVGQARLVVMSAVFGQQRVAVEGMTAAQIMAINAGTALRNIATKAAEAAASAYASIAAIPVIGPVLAPAAAATAFIAAGAFAKRIFSAEGGFDIPKGMNPMVQAHAEEMILPAKHANVIRALADGSSGGGGGSSTMNVTLKAAPLKGNFFVVHRDDLLAALKGAKRDFAF